MQSVNGKSVSEYTRDLVLTAVMAAIIFVVTFVLNFQSFIGFMHLGDTMIFVAAALLGKKKAAAASAIGMALFDLLSPMPYWAPFTFVVKGVMGYIAGSIAYRKGYEGKNVSNNIIAFIIAGIWMNAAYYVSGAIIIHYIYPVAGVTTWGGAFVAAAGLFTVNIVQVVIGIVLAIPLLLALSKTFTKIQR